MFPNLPENLQPRGLQGSALDLLRLLETSATIGLPGLPAPVVIVTPQGAPGSTTYVYSVSAISAFGASVTPSRNVQITNGSATLSSANYNRINWAPVPDAVGYAASRSTGGPNQGVIAVVPAGAIGECEPAGALIQPSFPLLPPFEIHDTGLMVLDSP